MSPPVSHMAGQWLYVAGIVSVRVTLFLSFISLLTEAQLRSAGGRDPSEDQDCDGFRVDPCGVCKGDGTSCRRFSGTFSISPSSMGYHKILDIPPGAMRMKIRETTKSRNYLAITTKSGESIINGHWHVNRPGVFSAAGTTFTYLRPNEIRSKTGESITALGPTSEELQLYVIYQQPGPSVYYEYILPNAITLSTETPHASDVLPLADVDPSLNTGELQSFSHPDPNSIEITSSGIHSNQVNQLNPTLGSLGTSPHPDQLSQYTWRSTGTTICSVTCGAGRRFVVFGCVEQVTLTTVPADLCDPSQRPSPQEEECNPQLCPAFWDVGEWSECSKTCGPGMQHRQVLCRQFHHNRNATTVESRHCQHMEQPDTTVTCQLKICSEWHIRSHWTPCSVPCGVGQRTRDVRCVDNLGDSVTDEECNMKLRPQDVENCDMGPCSSSWFFSLWSHKCSAECGQGIRSRSVVCLANHLSSLPLDGCSGDRPEETTPCEISSCQQQLEWYSGAWGQCSAECGNGTQSRNVACLLRNNGSLEVTVASRCAHLPRPPTHQPCRLNSCGARWYVTAWSTCSRSCEGGYRVRVVRCLADDMIPSSGCDPSLTPEDREECNTEPCTPEIDETCRDLYYNCNMVVQARLCIYAYYQTACCDSCRRASRRGAGFTHR